MSWSSFRAIANCILVIATFPDLQPPKIFFKIRRGKLPRRSKRHSSWAYKHTNILTVSYSGLYEVYYSLRKYLYITYRCYLRCCTVHIDNIKFFICPTNAGNSYKIVKLLKSFKITIVAPTCFGSHKPSSGSSRPVLHQSYNVDIGYIYRYLKLSALWLHILFSPVIHVDRAMCRVHHSHPTFKNRVGGPISLSPCNWSRTPGV